MKSTSSSLIKSEADYSLPVGPNDLCFDRNVFVKQTFSVDHFLQSHKKKANLETMRDDLGVYLKVLRSAMIELINKDYADFVNLSSNLIGLDKAIRGIQVPLGQLKEEILQVKQALDDAMNEVSSQLSERKLLRNKKQKLQSLATVKHLLKKMNHLLQDMSEPLSPALIERAASEFNHLQFAMFKCNDIAPDYCQQEADTICNILISNLDRMFLKSVQNKSTPDIARCLRIYMTLNRISYAEALFRKEVIAPSLNKVISENTLHSDPRNLKGVYSSILSFIDNNMKDLLEITLRTSTPSVTGFDFLVNSFWTEVEQRLEMHLASIYAPGNPEIFYKRYCETLEFLEKLNEYCSSEKHIKTLQSHPQYIQFLEHWNLPVYFQIRFQEIAGSLENILSEPTSTYIMERTGKFRLCSTSTMWEVLLKCWSDGVFLQQLGHRFWKLNLQILARYYVWVGDILTKKPPPLSPPPENEEDRVPHTFITSRMQFMVYLYLDIVLFTSNFPELEEKILAKLASLPELKQQLVEKCLEESKEKLLSRLESVTMCIVEEVSNDSLVQVRQVNDIPRLFRRTNREVPTRPCGYVAQVLAAPIAFVEKFKSIVDSLLLQQWLEQIFSTITEQYYSAVSDVLTSVQKTEESLRRLKKLRDRSGTYGETKGGGGDDDKIRQQLFLDVQHFSSEVVKMDVKKENVRKLENLLTLVEEAQKQNKLGDK